MAKVIGIDLGTTNTVVAVMDGPNPKIVETREGRSETRSVVSIRKRKDRKTGREEREELVGHVAEENLPLATEDTILSVKRLMGRAVDDPEVEKVRRKYQYRIVEPSDGTRESIRVVLDGKEVSPVDISAKILRRVKEDAERYLKDEVTHAVITVPAYFSQVQRDATRKAGLKAGLKVIKILDEPTAAAIAFGMDGGAQQEPKTVLVYDLGGGTFDISVLMMASSVFAPLALGGNMWLGGDDFDQEIIDAVVEHVRGEFRIDPLKNDPKSRRFMAELKKAARTTKERLTASQSTDLILAGLLYDDAGNLIDVSLEFTRADFEGMIRPLIERTMERTRQAIKDANLTADQIDHVLIAGNSSRIPLVQSAIEQFFGRDRVLTGVHPKHSVALGAAVVAALIGERVICQAPVPGGGQRECGHVNKLGATHCAREGCGAPLALADEAPEVVIGGIAPFHYGTQSVGDRFNLFISKGDPFPTEEPRTQVFFTTRPNQRMFSVPVFGGEDLEHASANEKQGEAFAILPAGLPKDTPIAIKLWLDSDGVFELSARLENGTELNPWTLTGEADAKAIETIQQVEQVLAARGADLAPDEMKRLDDVRNRAFDKMRRGDLGGALKEAERLHEMANEMGGAGPDELWKRAEFSVNYCHWLIEKYGWVDPNAARAFARLADDMKAAYEARNAPEVERRLQELDEAFNALPEPVRVFLAVRNAIFGRIRPLDLAAAARFERELDELEQAFKANDPRARERWDGFMPRLDAALARVVEDAGGIVRCSRGHEVPPGARKCPGCGEDMWILGTRPSSVPSMVARVR
ncbi:MAG: Hsp70 family protein [Deltaproteobacteria bacterium]|nr:Hsp70 family protein [Deltaproteobacteria bacterium]